MACLALAFAAKIANGACLAFSSDWRSNRISLEPHSRISFFDVSDRVPVCSRSTPVRSGGRELVKSLVARDVN
jgi:hypothetical protein